MKIRRYLLLVTFAVLVTVPSAIAQTKSKAAKNSCWSTAMTQRALNECGGKELHNADAELNRVYSALLQKLKDDPIATDTLKQAQVAWVAYRDAQMKALHPYREQEGSVSPMCWCLEMANLTVERTEILKEMLNPSEGDVCSYSIEKH